MKLVPFLLAFGLAACSSLAPAPDAGDVAEDLSRASAAKKDCAHLRTLHCLAGAPTAEGHACEEVEAAELDAGVPIPWGCRLKAETCAAIDACGGAK